MHSILALVLFPVRITDKHLHIAYRARHEDRWQWHLMAETKRRRPPWWEAVSLDVLACRAIRP